MQAALSQQYNALPSRRYGLQGTTMFDRLTGRPRNPIMQSNSNYVARPPYTPRPDSSSSRTRRAPQPPSLPGYIGQPEYSDRPSSIYTAGTSATETAPPAYDTVIASGSSSAFPAPSVSQPREHKLERIGGYTLGPQNISIRCSDVREQGYTLLSHRRSGDIPSCSLHLGADDERGETVPVAWAKRHVFAPHLEIRVGDPAEGGEWEEVKPTWNLKSWTFWVPSSSSSSVGGGNGARDLKAMSEKGLVRGKRRLVWVRGPDKAFGLGRMVNRGYKLVDGETGRVLGVFVIGSVRGKHKGTLKRLERLETQEEAGALVVLCDIFESKRRRED